MHTPGSHSNLENPFDTEQAELVASENLINCYLREGASFHQMDENHIRIALPNAQNDLIACYSRRLRLGDVRLKRLVAIDGASNRLSALELADLLATEVQGGVTLRKNRVSDWRDNFRSSRYVSEWIFNRDSKKSQSTFKDDISSFIASEQSLTVGHRFHPSPKSRIGFTDEDLLAYSPEFRPCFQLHYFAVLRNQNYMAGDHAFLGQWHQQASEFLPPQILNLESSIVIPVHPWQARQALAHPLFLTAIQAGEVKDLGICGPLFYPTASVRTLYQPELDLFVKASLDVRITNCFRPNLQPEMTAVSLIGQMLDRFDLEDESFHIMREPLCLDVDARYGVHFGAIFREGFSRSVKDGAQPLLAASLFGDREFSTHRLRELISETGRSAVLSWFAKYCSILIPPVMRAFWKNGLMLEPHLQNILVVHQDGRPRMILQRDLDNVKVVLQSPLDRAVRSSGTVAHGEIFYDADTAWKRLTYCLIVNHLSEAVSSLSALVTGTSEMEELESALWDVIRESLRQCDLPQSHLESLLNGDALWAKKNFFTRVVRGDDVMAPFAEVRNPLKPSR